MNNHLEEKAQCHSLQFTHPSQPQDSQMHQTLPETRQFLAARSE